MINLKKVLISYRNLKPISLLQNEAFQGHLNLNLQKILADKKYVYLISLIFDDRGNKLGALTHNVCLVKIDYAGVMFGV